MFACFVVMYNIINYAIANCLRPEVHAPGLHGTIDARASMMGRDYKVGRTQYHPCTWNEKRCDPYMARSRDKIGRLAGFG